LITNPEITSPDFVSTVVILEIRPNHGGPGPITFSKK